FLDVVRKTAVLFIFSYNANVEIPRFHVTQTSFHRLRSTRIELNSQVVNMKLTILFSLMCVTLIESALDFDCQKRIWDICYEDASYPSEEIDKKWRDLNEDKQMKFGKYVDTHWESEVILEPCKLCSIETSIKIQPLSLIRDTEKIYLLSTNKYPIPTIHVEVCRKNAKCMLENLQNDFATDCIQKTSKINVLSYNSTSKSFQATMMQFPSGCECVIEENAI
ncbi:unnamed protein product, partial [Phyllotreta striolata]